MGLLSLEFNTMYHFNVWVFEKRGHEVNACNFWAIHRWVNLAPGRKLVAEVLPVLPVLPPRLYLIPGIFANRVPAAIARKTGRDNLDNARNILLADRM